MKIKMTFLFFLLGAGLISACNNTPREKIAPPNISEQEITEDGLATAYFASGCFWCVEAIFQSVKGVKDAVSGYAGGEKDNPTYEEVSRGNLKHAEAVKVIYDPKEVDFKTLVEVFFGSHDPTTPNRQGPDRGPQYRSIAFYQTSDEKAAIETYISKAQENKTFSAPIVTEVKSLEKFWEAEEYHQEYENNHPENPYVQNVSIPRLKRFQAKFPELLKENH